MEMTQTRCYATGIVTLLWKYIGMYVAEKWLAGADEHTPVVWMLMYSKDFS
jgi:hypothetical protein